MKRKLQTALVGKLRVAVPCSATDAASVQAAHDAIRALTSHLPPGSTVEWIGSPDFGKVEVAPLHIKDGPAPDATTPLQDLTGDQVITRLNQSATFPPSVDPTGHGITPDPVIPESLRRVPRHG